MRKKRRISLVVATTLVFAAVAWLVFAPPSPLDRPVMDGQPIYYWLERMGSGDDRNQIRDRLVCLAPEVVPPLLAALEYRPSAIQVKISPFLEAHFPAAFRWLWRRGPSLNWMAAYTLSAMPPEPRIRDGFIRALRRMEDKNADSSIGFFAAQGLAEHYTNEPTILIPELRAALKVPHHNVAAVAARALPRFGTNGLIELPDLIDMLGGNDGYLIGHVAWTLGNFGRDAGIALPALRAQSTNQDATARRRVAIAIWQIAPETGFPAEVLLANMKAGWYQERYSSAEELLRNSPAHAPQIVETCADLIKSGPITNSSWPIQWHRIESARRLGEMGAAAKAALPVLREAETDGDVHVRTAATEACLRIETALAESQENQLTREPR
jgi:HEAT repeat protein